MTEQAMSQAWHALVVRGGCVCVCRVARGTPGSRSSREDALKALGARLLKQYTAVGRQLEAAAALRTLLKAAQAHAAGQERALAEQRARTAEVLAARSRQADVLRARNEELGRQVDALELALRASRELREEAMKVFVVLVAAEDNEALSEDEYDRRMDAAVKRARTLLSREKLQGATEIQLRAS